MFSVQSILYASGLLSASGVDGIWGPVTESAARTWQSRHGLTADGCWGFNTWSRAQSGYHNVSIGGEVVRFNHMTLTSQSNPNDVRWRYEEGNLSNGRRVNYKFHVGLCWWVDPPGTRGWTLVSHPGDTACG